MAKIDSSKSAIDNLLVLVNAANTGQTLLNTQVSAGTPSAQTADGQGRNTSVVLSAIAGHGYTGSQTFTYARRGLNDSVLNPVDSYTATTGVTAASLLTALAAQLGLVASELHLEDAAAPGTPLSGAISNNPATINIVSATGSLLYIDGSTQGITMTWNAPTVDLATAAPNTALSGFDAAS